jgi:ornithine cyclodeaminase/alanine dehydrogenase-like protein (mu-crystallin family)
MSVPIYLGEAQIRTLTPGYDEVCEMLRTAFQLRGRGETFITPKARVSGVTEGFFQAMPAIWKDLVVVKWVASGAKPDGTYIHAHLLASDRITGRLIAIMDFAWLTGVRTAAVSAVGVDLLAKPDASTLSIVGCGFESYVHLDALLTIRPIDSIVAVSRTLKSANLFADYARSKGVRHVVTNDTVTGEFYDADIVLSATPINRPPFLDATRIRPGSFMLSLELAHAWHFEGMKGFDLLFTDDAQHYYGVKAHAPNYYDLKFHSDLGSLLASDTQPFWDPQKRVAYVPPGLAYADAVLADLILERAGLVD